MKKLSELKDDTKIINGNMKVYDAGIVKCDIKHYIGGTWHIARFNGLVDDDFKGEQIDLSK